jgi:Domain of unknown function (DUF4347)/Periplasmic copper-binding protein (NosD)
MPVSSRYPSLKMTRPRSARTARLGQSWRRAHLRLDTFEDRSVPSATAATNEWATQLPNAPLLFTAGVRRELVIVDPRVIDYQAIVRDLLSHQTAFRRFDIAVLRADQDGLDQIARLLCNERDLAAIHFISHGSSDGLQLGATWLDAGALANRGGEVAAWAKSLKSGADLLFYECDLAGGTQGRELLESIRNLTGADVTASTDRTGAKALGGNWQLEYTAGHIETSLAVSTMFQQTYAGTLATFVVTSTSDAGAGSLRQAILNANANSPAVDLITFNIAGAGVHTITLLSPLPIVTEGVIIDGTTQPGFAGSPLIRVDGVSAGGGASGLTFNNNSDSSVVRSLMFTRFGQSGIIIQSGADNITIAGNWIGTDGSGSTALGNGTDGIQILGSNATVGGTTAADRNVISGNSTYGIELSGGKKNNVVLGNYIGVDVNGSVAIANGIGVYVDDPNATIGGTTAGARNVISGNKGAGVVLDTATADNDTVAGNYIGWNAAGTAIIGNGSHGILINAASNNTIGGTTAGAGNVIIGNLGDGIAMITGSGNQILGNSISANSGLGIDLNNDGVTPNDAGDGDAGANALKNFPVLTLVANVAGNTLFAGTYNSVANTTYRIEFFSSPAGQGDPSGFGEGKTYLGFITVTTDAAGNATFNAVLPVAVAVGDLVSATATDLSNLNTSEFAADLAVATIPFVVDTTTDILDGDTSSISALLLNKGADGFISLREAILATNNTANVGVPDTIRFKIGAGGLQTIQIGSTGLGALPIITEAVVIDGTTQTGYAGSPIIQLDGSKAGAGASGLIISAGGSTILGLAIGQFSQSGIVLTNAGGNTIQGDYLGLDATGKAAKPNAIAGIRIDSTSTNNLIGGATAADSNVISGNGNGIFINGGNNNTISGNYIGTDASGSKLIGNQTGVLIGNGASNNTIGGFGAGQANTIAGNNGPGISIVGGTGNQFLANSFHDNGGLAIDLNGDGVIGNDGATNPLQPNNGIDYAIITSVSLSGTTLTIAGTTGTPFATIQIYLAADDGNNNGPIIIGDGLNVPHGEGRVLLGTITADAAGNFNQALMVSGVALGDSITVLVTDSSGNTSEFSPNRVCVTPLITVSPLSLTTSESGTSASFTVVLTSAPSASVTITLVNGDPTEGKLSTTTLIFDATNWNTPQTVIVTGLDDFVIDGPITYTVTLNPATSADPAYNGLDPADVSVTNTDNDVAGFIVTPISGLTTTEAGGTASFTVVLTSQPTAPVTISVSSSNPAEGIVAVSSLTFDASNWNTPQTVTIAGVDDFVVDGNQAFTIILGVASSADPVYNGLDPANVAVTNTDNDTAGFIVTPINGLNTTEAGGTASFTVALRSQPTAQVTISVSSTNMAEGTVSVSSLTFDASNWNTPQTIIITGVDDFYADGDVSYAVTLSPATSADVVYNGQDPADVSVVNLNDDTAGIQITSSGSLIVDNKGTTSTVIVSLTSQPFGPVTIEIISANPNAVTTDPVFITFAGPDWASGVAVTMFSANGNRASGDVLVQIVFAASSSDAGYDGKSADTVVLSRVISGSGTPMGDSPFRLPPPPVVFTPPSQQSGSSDTSPITQDSGGSHSGSGAKRLPDGGGGGEMESAADAAASRNPAVEVAKNGRKLAEKTTPMQTAEVITAYKPLVVPPGGGTLGAQRLPDKVGDEITEEKSVRASSARMALGTVVIASAGCVLWSLRGAAWLLSAAASSAPAWTVLDPLALLMARQRRRKDDGGETLADLANAADRF